MRVLILFILAVFAISYILACLLGFVRWFNHLKWRIIKWFRRHWRIERDEEEPEDEEDGIYV
jgi:hypothetical protein